MDQTLGAMAGRIVRYADLFAREPMPLEADESARSSAVTFAIFGCEGRESEELGFSLGAVRGGAGGEVALSQATPRAYLVHTGCWRLALGPDAQGEGIALGPGDAALVPADEYRVFATLGGTDGFAWTLDAAEQALGPSSSMPGPGGTNHPPAWEGPVIDISSGGYVLVDKGRADRQLPEDANGLSRLGDSAPNPRSLLRSEGVAEAGVIGSALSRDGFEPGPLALSSSHALSLRRLTLASGAYVRRHVRREAEVLMIQHGALEVSWDGGASLLAAGDVAQVPAGLARAFRNTSSAPALAFVVRGSADPEPPTFL